MSFRIREPVNFFSHAVGAALAIAGLVYLVVAAAQRGTVWHVVSFSIFGASMVLLYAFSALYHLLAVAPKRLIVLRRLDHLMIFLLIAGSYTPICLIALRGPWGWSLFGVIWGMAVLGIFKALYWVHAPLWVTTGIYLVMGWLAIIALHPLVMALSTGALGLFVAGGLFYSVGAVIEGLESPNPFPGVFGSHEIWHFFVLAGTASHFFAMVTLL